VTHALSSPHGRATTPHRLQFARAPQLKAAKADFDATLGCFSRPGELAMLFRDSEGIMPHILRGRLTALYAAVRKGQFNFVLNAIHDDIEFISYSPVKVFPFLGHRRGKAAITAALHGAAEAFEFVACEPVSMVVEPDNAAVMLFTRGVSRATGRSVQGMVAHFLRFRDGKIVEVREFMDSLHAAEQALGRELIEGP
jgi:ketosteroid isomerase-like protein